jgi:hypothetical protein
MYDYYDFLNESVRRILVGMGVEDYYFDMGTMTFHVECDSWRVHVQPESETVDLSLSENMGLRAAASIAVRFSGLISIAGLSIDQIDTHKRGTLQGPDSTSRFNVGGGR